MLTISFIDKIGLRTFVTASLLGALNIVLTRYLSIELGAIRLGFGFAPILICSVLYGPIVAGFTYGISDLIGAFLQGFEANIGITFTSIITGVIFGLFLFSKKKNKIRITITHIINTIITGILLNTFFLVAIRGVPFFELLIIRLPAQLINLVIRIPLTYFMYVYVIEPVAKSDGSIELK